VKRTNQDAIRALLQRHTLGLTTGQMHAELGIHWTSLTDSLKRMPDAYVARWVKLNSKQHIPVWAVFIKRHAPKP
jgi:hypothetical protein